jgi:hypothetical protein
MMKRLLWCTIWLLGVVLICASLDPTPDPPALDPHSRIVKIAAPNEGPYTADSQFEYDHSAGLTFLKTYVVITEARSHRPIASIAETGQAADPSPPA